MAILIGTDGLCKNNQAKGGQKGTWAFAVFIDNEYKGGKKGHNRSTTNNEMELVAILEALKWANKYNKVVTILTDSSYAEKSINLWSANWLKNGWKNSKNEPVANQEVLKEILPLVGSSKIQWVKGHAGIRENEQADMLCNEEYLNAFV